VVEQGQAPFHHTVTAIMVAMDLTVERVGDVAVIALLIEELDASKARDFKRDIAPMLEAHSRIVLDLSGLRFADSSGLGAFIWCLRTSNANGGDLKLCGVLSHVREVFEIVRLNRIFDIYPTRDEAIRAFQP
jgi:anti-sigma B factor antagonist